MAYPKNKARQDLTGKQFGRLSVLEQMPMSHQGNTTWRCVCECGTERIVISSSLVSGNTTSCGCLTRENQRSAVALPSGEAAFNRIVKTYKDSARKNKRKFKLTKHDVRRLTKDNCFYCGCEPSTIKTEAHLNGSYIYNGIDRVDSDGDYTLDNVVTCCKHCNVAKRSMSEAEFASHVVKIYNHWARKFVTDRATAQ